ncbi:MULTISPECIES: hypothetical protein [unclassified Streptomyces]|uniref:hypothetical protein n=1 Tax=unclassified Streptomyces TaxID=2593676 RepID=UPI000DBA9972|nr:MULTISPECIES: hypothetical protein [unclassified Streptomyces]MYT71888.1 hypothetical protein [Streptomyces sp. SID8367]
MTYRRALVPAIFGALLLAGLLWWAGASAHALGLPGAARFFGPDEVARLRAWTTPWSTDSVASGQFTDPAGAPGRGADYAALRETAVRVRYVALVLFFACGAVPLLRRLSGNGAGRAAVAVAALWGWGIVAAVLAVTVSAPWMVASGGSASFRLLPRLASEMAQGREVPVGAALVAAAAAVGLTALLKRGATASPRPDASTDAPDAAIARLAATLGTAVVAFSLVVLSNDRVAGHVQTGFTGAGRLSEPSDLLRQWIQLGAWTMPTGSGLGRWVLYRLGDVVLLALVWWGLRLLPALLDHVTFPAYTLGAVAATTLGVVLNGLWSSLLSYQASTGGPLLYYTSVGAGVSAAIVFGTLAGCAGALTLRLRTRTRPSTPPSPQAQPA